MKKIVRGLCMLTVVALAFTSCKKNNNEQASAFNGSTQEFAGVLSENGERAYIDNYDNHMYFEEDDAVMLFNIDAENAGNSECALYHAETTGTNVRFIADEEMSATMRTAFYGFYPGSKVVPDLANGNRATFPVAKTQVYREDGTKKPIIAKECLYMAAKETTQDLSNTLFHFKNICGILVMPLYSTSEDGRYVQSIEIEDAHYYLTGDVSLKVSEVDGDLLQGYFNSYDAENPDPALAQYLQTMGYNVPANENKTNMVTLDCSAYENENEPNGVKLAATPAAAKPFCIVLRPLALSKGFTMRVNYVDANGQSGQYSISTTRDNKIKPNYFRSFSPVDIH